MKSILNRFQFIRNEINLLECAFNQKDEQRPDEPFPEIRSMKQHQNPERHVQQMRPVEYLETAASTHKWLRTNEHNAENDSQCDAGRIGAATAQSKKAWLCRQQPFVCRVSVTIENRIVDDDRRKIDQMHTGVHQTVDSN